MPNGGMINCLMCTYGRSSNEVCDVFGTGVSAFFLCRTFRKPRQSHTEARKHWPMLRDLEPGTVYEIDNSYPQSQPTPTPAYKTVPVGEDI